MAVGCGAGLGGPTPPDGASPGDGEGADGAEPEELFGACSRKPEVVVQDGHTRRVTDVALSRDGRVLATGSSDATVALWDTSSGLLLKRIHAEQPVEKIALSADGSVVVYRFVAGTKGRVVASDVSGRKPPQRFDGHSYFALSPDGSMLALRGPE
ncbi:MAG: hypothetical protein JRI23_30070, partial [Deltaproteobacteria bacterium]|nr:hypothetical protein [Deltaproteobacteria bacterium]MBW2536398.1 hypothetical protein [Deltaproteobacteria bacterium]